MLEKHLGKIPAGDEPAPVVTREPPQRAEKRIIMEDPSQPVLVIGYHKPDCRHPDNAVYNAISDIMGGGRSSRLHTSLVKEKQIAMVTGSMSELGQKYAGLFLFFAMPAQGHTNAECEEAIYEEIEKIIQEGVTEEELEGVKARAKAGLVAAIDSNMGMADMLASYQNLRGDWRYLFRELDEIDKVTSEDIQRVAKKTFVRSNRTVGMIETESGPDAAQGGE
jgi:predicted Zn-dependent peptidase